MRRKFYHEWHFVAILLVATTLLLSSSLTIQIYATGNVSNPSSKDHSNSSFPTTIGVSQTGSFELGGSEQRFVFYTYERWWVFYNDFASPNHNVVYTTSLNGINWAPNRIIQTGINGGADYFGIGLAGRYFYYASNNHSGTFDYIQWIRGTPRTNGIISWESSYNISLPVAPYNPTVTADTFGYPYISFNSADNNSYPYVLKSSLNNGTWETAPGYPRLMDSTTMTSNTRRIVIIPLSVGKMAAVWTGNGTVVRLESYDGISTWKPMVQTSSLSNAGEEMSVTAQNDQINIAFTCGHSICYSNYNYDKNALSSNRILVSTNYDPIPNLVQDGNLVYLFWGNINPPTFYYSIKSGSVWSSAQLWFVDENSNYSTNRPWLFTTPRVSIDHQIGLVYGTNVKAPFNLRFAMMAISTS